MRIRSIRPEFWSSEDVAAMDWHTRLVFIGLWSYVDDNGVGRDNERLITAALFPLDGDLRESSRRVTGALRHLSDHGQVTRYVVEGKAYLHVSSWSKHQRIEKASKGRYPLPTCGNSEFPEHSPTTPGGFPDMSTPGEGEKGRRGEGEKGLQTPPPAAPVSEPDGFPEFWDLYPRREAKKAAGPAYAKALKRATADEILANLRRQLADPNRPDVAYWPHAPTWLNNDRWHDTFAPKTNGHGPVNGSRESTTDQRVSHTLAMAARYAEQETREEQQKLEIGS